MREHDVIPVAAPARPNKKDTEALICAIKYIISKITTTKHKNLSEESVFLAGWDLAQCQQHDVLHMLRMREHVDGLYGGDAVLWVEEGQVAGLRGGVAAHVDNAGHL
jgi:hypothetical protein